jgi:hypothetical protein
MPRARCKFRETEVRRIVRAVEKATGAKAARVECDPETGKIIVFPGGEDKTGTAPTHNEWDEAAE